MNQIFKPFHYQPAMIDHLVNNHQAALFVPPGKGKTVVTLTALDRLAVCGDFKGALIVAPLRVCSITWPAQVERWAHTSWMRVANLRTTTGMQAWHDGSADIYLINSELLPARLPQMFPPRSKHCPVDTLVIDELSLAKNHASKRFNALRKVIHKFTRRWGLTGTPVPNNYLDLFAQARLLDDGERLGKSYTSYRDRWFYPADYMGYTYKLQSKQAKCDIDKRMATMALVIIGDDSDLPASSTVDVHVNLPVEAKKQYRTLQKEMLAAIADGEITAPSAATLCGKLLQITGGAVYDEDRKVLPVHDAKLDALRDLLEKHKDEPVLVLCAFKHESARIIAGIPHAQMFDELLLKEWQAGKIPVWVADPRSLSHGIDGMQVSCRIAIWATLTYSHETYTQTNARIVRTGQASESIIYRLIAPGTIDDAVAEALREKSGTESGMMHAVHALQRMVN
jgi:superfamily II DNA or RNA helicase